MNPNKKKKIIFFVSEDWYFYSHRLSIACELKNAGFDVVVVTNLSTYLNKLEGHGFKVINMDFKRESINPFKIYQVIKKLKEIYLIESPDVIHNISLMPIILGTLSAKFFNSLYVINTFTGLGHIFSSKKLMTRIIRILILEPVLNMLLNKKNVWAIVQNIDDMKLLNALKIINKDRTVLIKGSGVDIEKFKFISESEETPVVVLATRMLRDKGVEEYISSVRELKKEKIDAEFILVGDVDLSNPSSIREADILSWQKENIIDWWGYRNDMEKVFANVHIVCLPSYREGLPKVLLEAAAVGRPIVATDVPGCREIVRDGENGLLVPVKNSSELSLALKKLIADKALRKKMGARGRTIVENEFSYDVVNAQTLALYDRVLADERCE